MIIFILFIFVILAFVSLMMIQDMRKRIIAVAVSFLIVITSVVLIIANMHDHFGMKVQTTTTKQQIYSVQGQNIYGVLSYQQVGTSGKEKVFIYRDTSTSTTPTVAKPDLKTKTAIQNVQGNQAFKVTTSKNYVYRNGFYKFMFAISGNNHDLKARQVTYQVPLTWLALSSQDGERLKSIVSGMANQADFIQWFQQVKSQSQTDPDGAAQTAVSYYQNLLANNH